MILYALSGKNIMAQAITAVKSKEKRKFIAKKSEKENKNSFELLPKISKGTHTQTINGKTADIKSVGAMRLIIFFLKFVPPFFSFVTAGFFAVSIKIFLFK